KTITLSNIGTVTAEVTAVATASSELGVRFLQGDCAAPISLPTADSNGSPVPLGDLAAGISTQICLEVTLSSGAVAPATDDDAAVPFAVAFTATQKVS